MSGRLPSRVERKAIRLGISPDRVAALLYPRAADLPADYFAQESADFADPPTDYPARPAVLSLQREAAIWEESANRLTEQLREEIRRRVRAEGEISRLRLRLIDHGIQP